MKAETRQPFQLNMVRPANMRSASIGKGNSSYDRRIFFFNPKGRNFKPNLVQSLNIKNNRRGNNNKYRRKNSSGKQSNRAHHGNSDGQDQVGALSYLNFSFVAQSMKMGGNPTDKFKEKWFADSGESMHMWNKKIILKDLDETIFQYVSAGNGE